MGASYVPTKLIVEACLTMRQLSVAMLLQYHVGKNESTYVSLYRLAKESSSSEKTIRKTLYELRDLKVIDIRRRGGETSLYSFTKEFLKTGRVCRETNTPTPDYRGTPTLDYRGTPTPDYLQSNKENQAEENQEKNLADQNPSALKSFPPLPNWVEKNQKWNYVGNIQVGEEMKSNDILKKRGITSTGQITVKSEYQGNSKAGELAHYWKTHITDYFPSIKQVKFVNKHFGMFKKFSEKVAPHDPLLILECAFSDWYQVGPMVVSQAHDCKDYPSVPSLPFILTHSDIFVNYYLGTTKTTQSIPSPIFSNKVAEKPNIAVEPEDKILTADDLEYIQTVLKKEALNGKQ